MNKTIIIGGGCFWCIEAIFQRLKGVTKVQSGYAGGHKENPTYKEVCMGNTGHAEVVKIEYDPEAIALDTLLAVFFDLHDPTTLNQQGADKGTQYRSILFYSDLEERQIIVEAIAQAQKKYENPIVTEVQESVKFYPAEEYHDNYYNVNGSQPYCSVVISPKVKKLMDHYSEITKDL